MGQAAEGSPSHRCPRLELIDDVADEAPPLRQTATPLAKYTARKGDTLIDSIY